VLPGNQAWSCANFLPEHGGCGFAIPRTFRGGAVSEDQARDLLSKGRTFTRVRVKTRTGEARMLLRLADGKLEAYFRD
jgi:hypothetical protein